MTTNRWPLVSRIFDEALAIEDTSERASWLKSRCGEDNELYQEISSLLVAHFSSNEFLEHSALEESTQVMGGQVESIWVGRVLGNWRIDRLIHQGGMGSVFLASRMEGGFEQVAALKVIRAEMANDLMLERFARERQVLARLDHPNISRILDGGMTDNGVPWLVMEYVDGMPVDAWCDSRQATLTERLELFEQICDAVSYAHQQLIIHRDIKPDNILVNQQGLPKLLDFGIAKLMKSEGEDGQQTVTSQRILTPAYASPEQFRGGAVGTASDVYSLGMLLYELLAGALPYKIDTSESIVAIDRLICLELPAPPSHKLRRSMPADSVRAVAANRQLTPDQLRRELKGDLDIILLKALRKEPERRYASVDALREDLRRYRQGLPVSARPDTAAYRASRFLRRHWLGVGATAAVIVALMIGLAAALMQTEQLRNERDRTLQVNRFLQDILIEADPYQAGADVTVRDLLRQAGEMVEQRFMDQPDLEASLRLTIGKTQLNLMELESANANLERSVELNHSLYGHLDERSLQSENWLAWLAYRAGDYALAEQRYREIIERLDDRHPWSLRAEVLNELAIVLVDTGQIEPAQQAYQQALEMWLANEPDNLAVAILHNNIAGTWRSLDSIDQAIDGYGQALYRLQHHFPDGQNPYVATTMTNLAIMLQGQGQHEEALDLHRQSLEIRLSTLGENHAATGMGHLQLGRLLLEMSDPEQARTHVEHALAISKEQLGPNQLQVLLARAAAARLAYLDGDAVGALSELSEVRVLMTQSNVPTRHIEEVGEWIAESRSRLEAVRSD
jgi:eukaryotic-like serine/threonine-protein kinase